MEKLDAAGFFEVFIPDHAEVFRYRFRVEKGNGEIRQFFDPYSFLPTLSQQDQYLINEGTEHRVYQKLGAHLREVDGVHGVSLRRLGAECQSRVGRGRLQPLGRALFPDALARQLRRLGNFHPRPARRACSTNTKSSRARARCG